MSKPRFHTLEIAEVAQETSDAVVLRFQIPEDLKSDFSFTPGQYLTLRANIDGKDVRRSYSICSPVEHPTLDVGVKRIDGGAFSSFAQCLKAGDTLQVMTPQGRFLVSIDGDAHSYLLLAAGSGITPMVSIAKSVLVGEPNSRVTLCYANRSSDGIMFKSDFDDLKDRFFTRFQLTHILDEEYQDIDLFNGRLDGEKLSTLATAHIIDPLNYDAVYICGPAPMIEATQAAMIDLGVEKERLRFELFTPAGGNPTASSTQQKLALSQDHKSRSRVEFVLDGATRGFDMEPSEALIDAVERAGLEIPYSCNNGMCATCRCKLVSGDATMKQNFSLEPWEEEAGFLLACQIEPKSERLVLDFDAL